MVGGSENGLPTITTTPHHRKAQTSGKENSQGPRLSLGPLPSKPGYPVKHSQKAEKKDKILCLGEGEPFLVGDRWERGSGPPQSQDGSTTFELRLGPSLEGAEREGTELKLLCP